MSRGSFFEAFPAYPLAFCLAVAIILVLVLASRLGRRAADVGHVLEGGAAETTASGLLGLLLAFNFSIAQSRFDDRQQTLVREANAIGTAHLRCSVLPAEPAKHCRDLFRRYVDLRIAGYAAYGTKEGEPIVVRDLAEGEHIQRELWTLVARDVRAASTPANSQLMGALNEVIDLDAERRASILIAVPRAVSIAIVIVCLAWAALVGYASGAKRNANLVLWVAVAIPISVVFGVALDFDRPRSGFITTHPSERAMSNLARSMADPVVE